MARPRRNLLITGPLATLICLAAVFYGLKSSTIQVHAGSPVLSSGVTLPSSASVNWLPLILVIPEQPRNGGFELGQDGSGQPFHWTIDQLPGVASLPAVLANTSPSFLRRDLLIPYGMSTLLLGNPAYPCEDVPVGAASLSQKVEIPGPQEVDQLFLVFNYIVYSQDISTLASFDRFEVYIDDGSERRLVFFDGNRETWGLGCRTWKRIPENGWGTARINLTAPYDFRGQAVTLSFQNWNRMDHYYNTLTYLDNVYLEFDGGLP